MNYPTYGTLTYRVKHLKAELADTKAAAYDMYREYEGALDNARQEIREARQALNDLVQDMVKNQEKMLTKSVMSMVECGTVAVDMCRDEMVRGEQLTYRVMVPDTHLYQPTKRLTILKHSATRASRQIADELLKRYMGYMLYKTKEIPFDHIRS